MSPNLSILTAILLIFQILLAWYQFFYKRRAERRNIESNSSNIEAQAALALATSAKTIDELRDKVLVNITAEADQLRIRLEVVEKVARQEKTQYLTQIAQLRSEVNDSQSRATSLAERAIHADELEVELQEANRQINIFHMRLDECRGRVKELETLILKKN